MIAVPKKFNAAGTSVYGPDVLEGDDVNYVGAYTKANPLNRPLSSANPAIVGFAYTGQRDGSTTDGWRRVQGVTQSGLPGSYTFVHSVDGGHAVGNADNAKKHDQIRYFSLSSTAFVLDVASGQQRLIRYPGQRNPLVTHTAYGIWNNEDGSYTIAGGSGEVLPNAGNTTGGSLYPTIGQAYLIDYHPGTEAFFNYQTFKNTDTLTGSASVTHFEGIYRDQQGHYHLPAT